MIGKTTVIDIVTDGKLKPIKTIRHYCFSCVGYVSWNEVEQCGIDNCPFFEYRLGKGRVKNKVFRQFCLQCMGDNSQSAALVKECPTNTCFIYPYRFGKNPALKGIIRGSSSYKKVE
jgi:hypothetical protein